MAPRKPPPVEAEHPPQGDPWHAVGYLTAGVLLYGGLGWLLDHWLGTRFWVVIGILFGTGLGLYATWSRFRPETGDASSPPADHHDGEGREGR